MRRFSLVLTAPVAAFFMVIAPARAAGPVFNATGPEAALFGAAEHYPAGDRATNKLTSHLVGAYSRYDTIYPSHRVAHATVPWAFRRAAVEPEIHYDFGGQTLTLDHYLAHFPVTGLLVLQGDTILLERYQYGRTDADRFMSASMAKSVMALLAGVALGEGSVRSLDDHVSRYVPELKNTLYGESTLRDLLHMSSGVEFEATVNGVLGDANTQKIFASMFDPAANPVALLASCTKRAYPAGTHFYYSPGDNQAAALMLQRATGRTLAEYLSEKIWQPIGAEADATWMADPTGLEFASTGFNAVLRDYARLGRLLAYDGAWNGRQIVPKAYVLDATTPHPADPQLAPGTVMPYYGYGYQIWIFPGARRMFVFRGANSQYVFVDPRSKLVLVQTAVRSEGDNAANGKSETLALWLALVKQFGAEPRE